jgi:hypothetical protein
MTRSPYFTALPVLIDERMITFGGTIEVTDYAFTGTDAVGTNVVRTLGYHSSVILASYCEGLPRVSNLDVLDPRPVTPEVAGASPVGRHQIK